MLKVSDVMGDPVTVGADVSLREVAGLLADREVRGVSVVDGDGRLVGMVCDRDLVRAERGKQHASRRRRPFGPRRSARNAREAMRSPGKAVESWAAVSSAVPLLVEGDPLSVVQADRVVGLLTPNDVVRAFARPDAELAREIRDQIRGACWSDPTAVVIKVDQGRVALSGRVDARATMSVLPEVVLRIPGVASVESTLAWAGDERFR